MPLLSYETHISNILESESACYCGTWKQRTPDISEVVSGEMLILSSFPSSIEAAIFCVSNHGFHNGLCDWMPGA
ncbi:hypothetical protein ACFX1R_024142 [Malus domestica]